MNKKLNNIMLIGGMKCGTSSLYRWLEVNPSIITAHIKEPEFFSDNHGKKLNIKEYSNLFKIIPDRTLYTLDASTGYAKYPYEPNVAQKIFEYNPKSKIIYIVRNPFDRIISHYGHLQTKTKNLPKITADKFINYSNYNIQLQQYTKFFPLEQILVLDFDDLRNEPSKTLDKVFDFLEVEEKIHPNSYEVRNRTSQKSNYKIRKLQNMFSFITPLVPEDLKNMVKTKVSKQITKPKLTTEQKQYIKNQLNDDMIQFSKKYKINVRKWGFNE